MRLPIESGQIIHSQGFISARFPVLDAREIGDTVVILYDYMAFARDEPARNLFAYCLSTGKELWRADGIGLGTRDAYTNVSTESPLVVGNFAGYNVQIDLHSGRVISTAFTK